MCVLSMIGIPIVKILYQPLERGVRTLAHRTKRAGRAKADASTGPPTLLS